MPPHYSICSQFREYAPVWGLFSLLCANLWILQRNQWFSPRTNLYVHTLTWTATFLASGRFLLHERFSLMLVGMGLGHNTYMLWDMYHLLGCNRCGVEMIRVADLVIAGCFTAVAVSANYCFAARCWRAAEEVPELRGGKSQSDLENG